METEDSYDVMDFKSSEIATISSYQQLFDYYMTINDEFSWNLLQWIWLKNWNILSMDDKLKKYEKYLSHELHLFLMKKDNEFFNNICIKHIESKLNKDFMDYYFLNDTNHLIQYTQLHYFQKLNPMEQILLASVLNNDQN